MKIYKTNIPCWSKERGDYDKPAETPEKLYSYSFYNHQETTEKPLILFAIGGNEKDNYSSNFDYYMKEDGTIYSIPRKESGCRGTYFGDVNHIKRLIRQGHFHNTFTTYGANKMYEGRRRA